MASGVVTTVVNLIVAAVSYSLYLHFLGYEKYGLWLILATIMTFAQLGNLGLGPAVMKLVAEEYGRRNLTGIESYVATALAILCASGIVILFILLIMKGPIISIFKLSDINERIALHLLPFIGCLTIYVFIVQVFGSVLSGLGRMDIANYIQTLGGIVQLAISGLFIAAGFDVISLLFGNMASYFLVHILTLLCIRSIKPLRFFKVKNLSVQRGRRLISFGGGVFAGSLVNMLLNPLNKIILSRYAGIAVVPVYEIAFTGSFQLRALFEAGLRGIVPEISRVSAEGTKAAKERISRLYHRTMKLTLLLGIPIYSIVFMIAPVLLKLWLGAMYVEALPAAFRIMLGGTFVSLIGISAYFTLLGLGYVRYIFESHLYQSVANILAILSVAFFFLPTINSIIWCTSFSMFVSTAYLLYQNALAVRALPVRS